MVEEPETVYVVDDNDNVRKALSRLIKSTGRKVESFSSASEFLELESIQHPGCILIDVKMPKMDGPELQKELLRRHIDFPIIFLTGFGDIPTSVKAIKMGAVDFLTKPVDESILLNAIDQAMKKDKSRLMEQAENDDIQDRLNQLTPRESEVFHQVVHGHANKVIAHHLGIAEKTVKIHRGNMMRKTKVKSVAKLVLLAIKSGIRPDKVKETSANRMK